MSGVQPWPGPQPPWDPQQRGWQPAPNPQSAMRAAHTDRERTVDVLKAGYAEGRLSAQEYSERFDAVHRAQTYGQLAQLVGDLPAGPMSVPSGVAMPMAPATFLPPPVHRLPAPNGLAVASLVLGLLCLPTMGLLGLPALVTGHLARQQIRSSGERGEVMAMIGLVIGWTSTAGWLALLLLGVAVGAHG